MAKGLLDLHSALRWIGLILLIATIVDSVVRMYRPFKENERKLALFTLIAFHSQLLTGLILYFVSPTIKGFIQAGDIMKNSMARFYIVEHLAMMLIAIAIITIGYSRAKRQSESWAKHRMLFFYYLTALLIILISIPWPFRVVGEGRGWF